MITCQLQYWQYCHRHYMYTTVYIQSVPMWKYERVEVWKYEDCERVRCDHVKVWIIVNIFHPLHWECDSGWYLSFFQKVSFGYGGVDAYSCWSLLSFLPHHLTHLPHLPHLRTNPSLSTWSEKSTFAGGSCSSCYQDQEEQDWIVWTALMCRYWRNTSGGTPGALTWTIIMQNS